MGKCGRLLRPDIRIIILEKEVNIIEYSDDLAPYFKELNVAWLRKYFYVEPIDEEMLSHPKENIINKDGHIFFSQIDQAITGTFALMKLDDQTFELGKMAVDEGFQGQKIGNRMLDYAIQKTKDLGASKLILYSNTLLAPAIHLYKKYGFVEVPLENSEYKRSNIKMEKLLS